METGMVIPFAGASAPSGYLLCDGASYSRSTYSVLFGVVGTVFGAADGSHFNVPDLRGRVPVGVGEGAGNGQSGSGAPYPPGIPLENYALGDWFGGDHSQIDIPNLPEHDHTLTDPGHTHSQNPHEHTALQGTGGSTLQQQTGGSNNGYVFNPAGTNNGTTTMNTNDATATNQSATTGITCGQTGGNEPLDIRNPAVVLNYLIKA